MAVNNTLIGALRAEATLESGKFVDGAKKIQSEARKTESTLKSSFSGAAAAIKGFGGAISAGLSVGLLAGIGKKLLDNVAALKTTAAQLGVTTKELQQFSYAAGQVGIKQADADKALERLNASMGKAAAGSKAAIAAFNAVGVSVEDIKTKSKTEIFGQIADQMIKQGGAAKNAAAANAIFGEGAAKLAPLLDKGSAGMRELAAAAERLGIVLSDRQIQQADETAQKLDDVKRVLAAQISGVVADNAQSILTLANALGQLTSSIISFLGSNPTLALGILGALAGGRVGGLPGAAAGGFAGAVMGAKMAGQREPPTSTALLAHNLRKERDEMRRLQTAGDTQGARRKAASVMRLADRLNSATGNVAPVAAFDVPEFMAGAPKKGRTPRAKKGPRDRSDDVAYQFEQEQLRAEADILRARRSLATTADDRAAISLQLLDLDREQQQAELDNRVRRAERDFAEGRITAGTLEEAKAQAATLQARYDEKDALERQAITDDLAAEKSRDRLELSQSAADIELELLQLDSALAETAAEKREVELRILAAMKEQERARLEAVIADKQSSELARQQAQQRLAELDGIYSGREAAVRQGTRGPMESYLASLPNTAAKWTEALEEVRVRGLQGIEDGLMDVITGAKTMGEAFKGIVNQILQDLMRLAIQKYVVGGLAKALGLAGGAVPAIFGGGMSAGGSSLSGSFSPTAGFPSLFTTPGMAQGGSGILGGRSGTDRNLLSLNGLPIARVSKGEMLTVSNDNQGGVGGKLEIMPSPLFDVYLDGKIVHKAGPMVGHGMVAAAGGAQASIARRQRRSLV